MKIILINGAPRSGKDTAGLALCSKLGRPVHHEKFSRPLKTAFAGMMDIPIGDDFVVPYYEEHKELVIPTLGVSYRRWQQDFSEKFMKPMYGDAVFAKLLVKRLADAQASVVVITDCGFQCEVNVVASVFPASDIQLIRIYRDGTSFDGDTRDYVLSPPNVLGHILHNNHSREDFERNVIETVRGWL